MEKHKYLILVENYPDNKGNIGMNYVHTRNLAYKKAGFDITVLNFSAQENYCYEGIDVINYQSFVREKEKYEALILHSANIKHHYEFLRKHGIEFKQFIFFYHGHEVMYLNKDYSKPFDYIKQNAIKIAMQNLYDHFKMLVWHNYLKKHLAKSTFIFVSNWMKRIFLKNIKLKESDIEGRSYVVYNGVGESFENGEYNEKTPKEYDFITIRSVFDNSKYGVDIVARLAENTPKAKFLLVGKGHLFEHIQKPENVEIVEAFLNHEAILEYLQKARFALMPTRTDAQGLMMCEMAAFGIPVITSDIDVCKEVFNGFENVYFINNDTEQDLVKFKDIISKSQKDKRFYKQQTVRHEIKILNEVLSREE